MAAYILKCKGCGKHLISSSSLPSGAKLVFEDYPDNLKVIYGKADLNTAHAVLRIVNCEYVHGKKKCTMECKDCDRHIAVLVKNQNGHNGRTAYLKFRDPGRDIVLGREWSIGQSGRNRRR